MEAKALRWKRPQAVAETRRNALTYALIIGNGYQEHDRFPVLDAAWP